MKQNKIELLAPAGTFESLIAAIQNGADAVYIGGTSFGARSNAGNFDDEEIVRAIKYAHLRNVQIYVTVNTLINDNEIEECLEYISFLYKNDVDAIILQDFAISCMAKKLFPDLEIHASTQMSITNIPDSELAKDMGFDRIVLARENSLDEIKAIKEKTNLEIEAFVHGALCVSYSGKCLFSFVQGGRSGNRGSCAQPCRMKYTLLKNDSKKLIDNKYALSMKDLSTINQIEDILESNAIDSLKIEGRMKRPEYVSTVVKNYRQAVDSAFNNEVSKEELQNLEKEIKYVFNREYTKGHLMNENANSVVNFDIPKNKGIYLGDVIQVNKRKKRITLRLEDDLRKGDGLSLGEYVGRIIIGKNILTEAKKGDIVEIDFIGNVDTGTKVYKTYNKTIMESANESLKKENIKFPIDCKILLYKDKNPEIVISDENENTVCYKDETHIIELANNKPSSDESIEKQIAKLESTVFYLRNLEIEKDDNIIIPLSVLNKLRREALTQLEEKRTLRNHRDIGSLNLVEDFLKNQVESFKTSNETLAVKSKNKLAVRCFTKEQYRACVELGADKIYISDLELYKSIITNSDCELYYLTPSMMKDSDIAEIESFILEYKPNVVTSSLGFGQKISRKYSEADVNAKVSLDYMANLNNKFAMEYAIDTLLTKIGTITPGIEYGINQENSDYVFSEKHKSLVEIMVSSHPLLMITEYCPYKSKDKSCTKETCNINDTVLISESNEQNILKRELNCKVCIYSKKTLDLHKESIKILKSKGYSNFRIDLLDENYEQTRDIIRKYNNIK